MMREEVVLVNPIDMHQFSIHLGEFSEILWIENDEVYYRIFKDLYKATIKGDDFVDRKLVLSDFRVFSMHWAFSSSNPD